MELPDLFVFRVCLSFLLVQCPRPWQLALSNSFVHNLIFFAGHGGLFCRQHPTVFICPGGGPILETESPGIPKNVSYVSHANF